MGPGRDVTPAASPQVTVGGVSEAMTVCKTAGFACSQQCSQGTGRRRTQKHCRGRRELHGGSSASTAPRTCKRQVSGFDPARPSQLSGASARAVAARSLGGAWRPRPRFRAGRAPSARPCAPGRRGCAAVPIGRGPTVPTDSAGSRPPCRAGPWSTGSVRRTASRQAITPSLAPASDAVRRGRRSLRGPT